MQTLSISLPPQSVLIAYVSKKRLRVELARSHYADDDYATSMNPPKLQLVQAAIRGMAFKRP